VTTNRLELLVVDAWDRPDRFEDPGEADDDSEDIGGYGRELLIAIDDRLELRVWGGLGMEPDSLLNSKMPLLPPEDGVPMDAIVQRCGCGEVGCGSLTVTIVREGDRIRWSDVREGPRKMEIGPFTFDADVYEAEVRRAHDDRPWESQSERIARLLIEQLAGERDSRPLAFVWAAGREGSVVDVSYFDYRPNPAAGGRTPAGRRGVFMIEPDELFEQYVGSFEFPPNDLDDDIVHGVLQQIRAIHPRDWPPAEDFRDMFIRPPWHARLRDALARRIRPGE
jgi:hypothetical protein